MTQGDQKKLQTIYSTEKLKVPKYQVIRGYDFGGNPIDLDTFSKICSERNSHHYEDDLIIDVGFTDYGIRLLEHLVIDYFEKTEIFFEHLFIWNITSDWSQFRYLFGWLLRKKTNLKTIIFVKDNNEISIIYKLKKDGDEWLVFDVVIEGASVIKQYRRQFSLIITEEKIEGLMIRLEEKIKTADAGSAS